MAKVRIAINGYGRIGRNILRALYEGQSPAGVPHHQQISLVAINDLADPASLAHLTRYDSVHGRFSKSVSTQSADPSLFINANPQKTPQTLPDNLVIDGDNDGDAIAVCHERDPINLPWHELGVDVVCECTGLYSHRQQASAHLSAGAKRVVISAPAADADATIVYGINHQQLQANHQVISNASCTTNCLAPMVWPLHQAMTIEQGLMTTIHAYTNDQHLTDVYQADLYRARAATLSMIPTRTGAAAAVGLVLPDLAGRLDGLAVRVPTINVSMVDLNYIAGRNTSVTEVNDTLCQAADGSLRGILACNDQPLVSIDFNHHPASAIIDLAQTRVSGRLVKVMAWYDNEWGFSNRMLDTAVTLQQASG